VEVPPEICRAVSRYKKELSNVASCWIYIGTLTMHGPMKVESVYDNQTLGRAVTNFTASNNFGTKQYGIIRL